VTLAVASVLIAAEIEAAMEAVFTLRVVEVAVTAPIGAAVAVGEGASSTALKSNICGAGAAAAMRARAAARMMLDLIVMVG